MARQVPRNIHDWISLYADDFGYLPTRGGSPTKATPGSIDKVDAMIERVRRGEPVFVDGDKVRLPWVAESIKPVKTAWIGNSQAGTEESEDRRFRYRLWRRWGSGGVVPTFVGLRPDASDEKNLSKVGRKIEAYCRQSGCDGFQWVNLFAAKTPSKAALVDWEGDVIGDACDRVIRMTIQDASYVVCGWGEMGCLHDRGARVLWAIKCSVSVTLVHCFGLTKMRPSRLKARTDTGCPIGFDQIKAGAVTIPMPWDNVDLDDGEGELGEDELLEEWIPDWSGGPRGW